MQGGGNTKSRMAAGRLLGGGNAWAEEPRTVLAGHCRQEKPGTRGPETSIVGAQPLDKKG
jgi:hypothetical protein